ncbi:hypothetical protein [Ruminococcus callidus]|uniref:hypothetical protein n=1 Tax=Ruminococcus callidus TaxID=40519 RepID=UPI003522B2D7
MEKGHPDSRWCKGSTVQGQRCPRFHTVPAQTAFSQVQRNIFQNTKKLLSCDLCGELRILRRIHFLAVPEKPPYSPCGFSGFLKSWKNFKATPHKDCATDASPIFSSNETKSGVNT